MFACAVACLAMKVRSIGLPLLFWFQQCQYEVTVSMLNFQTMTAPRLNQRNDSDSRLLRQSCISIRTKFTKRGTFVPNTSKQDMTSSVFCSKRDDLAPFHPFTPDWETSHKCCLSCFMMPQSTGIIPF
jgi:hypothetical protein